MTQLHTIQNAMWQVGVLPETGGAVAFGRVRQGNDWTDILRPTDPANYANVRMCSSFILLPYSNRIRDAQFVFNGTRYALEPTTPEGNAQHGDVRSRPWQIEHMDAANIHLRFDSRDFNDINFPFAFSARASYELDGPDFVMNLTILSEDARPFPAGMGHHPYFVRTMGGDVDTARIMIPARQYFPLEQSMAVGPPAPVPVELDFTTPRALDETELDAVLTDLDPEAEPIRMSYPAHGLSVAMLPDPIFKHIVVYAPSGKPFYAVEPVTNVNDGFNLFERGVPDTGVFVLEPGERRSARVILRASDT